MAEIIVQEKADLSGPPSFVAASSGGHYFRNVDNRTVLVIQNGAAPVIELTVHNQRPCSFATAITDHPDYTLDLPGIAESETAGFDPRRFNDVNGNVQFEFDDEAPILVAAVHDSSIFKD